MPTTTNLVIARAQFPETGGLRYTLVWDEDEGKVVHVDAPIPRSVERMLAVDARVERLVGLLAPTPAELGVAVRAMDGKIGRWRRRALSPFISALYRRGAPVWQEGWSPDDESGLLEANMESKGQGTPLDLRDSYRSDIIATVVLAQQEGGGFKAAGAADGVIELVVIDAAGVLVHHDILLGDTEATNAMLPAHLALPGQASGTP